MFLSITLPLIILMLAVYFIDVSEFTLSDAAARLIYTDKREEDIFKSSEIINDDKKDDTQTQEVFGNRDASNLDMSELQDLESKEIAEELINSIYNGK